MTAHMVMAVGLLAVALSNMIHLTVMSRVQMDHGYDVASAFAVLSSICGMSVLLLSELMRL